MQPALRSPHFDALRGIGAIQVLLLHGFGAFLPELVSNPTIAWLLYDGETAVFVFFLLSGAVLTDAFTPHAGFPLALIAARLLRFVPPVAAAAALALLLFRAVPDAHLRAGLALPGSWLAAHWNGDGSAASLLRDAGVNVFLLGYHGLSLLAADAPTGDAYNAPLWTLSLELQGSALILLLVMLRRRAPLLGLAVAVGLALLLARTPLVCFVLGNLAATGLRRKSDNPIGLVALASGLLLAFAAALAPASIFVALAQASLPIPPAFAPVTIQRAAAAALIFAGVLLLAPLRERLRHPCLLWLGRMSFSIYLVHWPVIFGPGAALFLILIPSCGEEIAAGLACGGSIVLSLLLARLFRPLDEAAMGLSRRLRAGLSQPPAPRAVFAQSTS